MIVYLENDDVKDQIQKTAEERTGWLDAVVELSVKKRSWHVSRNVYKNFRKTTWRKCYKCDIVLTQNKTGAEDIRSLKISGRVDKWKG